MKCAYCGKNNKPGAVVCKRCGVALPVPPPADPNGKTNEVEEAQVVEVTRASDNKSSGGVASKKLRMSRKTALIGIAAIIAVIAAAVLTIVIIANSGNLVLHKASAYFVNGSAVFYKGEPVVPEAAGNTDAASDLSGSIAAIKTRDGNLYLCSKGENKLAAKNVEEFSFSVDGHYLVYSDDDGMLWRYDCRDASVAPVCVYNNVVKDAFAVSPNGDTVLFTKGDDSSLCAYVKGKIKTFESCSGHIPVSVSDNAKHVYSYSPDDNSLYYTNSKGKTNFVRSNLASEIYLNSRHDEIVFASNSGNMKLQTLISIAGEEPIELKNAADAVRPVLPVSGVMMNGPVYTCPFKTFSSKLFSGSGLVMFDKKTGVKEVVSDTVSSACATDNYAKVFYVAGGALSSVEIKSLDTPQRVAESCRSFALSTNGKIIWYADLGNVLHCIKNSKDYTSAIGVDEFFALTSGKSAVFTTGGSLYMTKSANPTKCYPVETGSVSGIFADANALYYCSETAGWQKINKTGKAVDLTK